MGKSLNGKELGNGISQRKDGLYQARFINRFGKRQTIYAKTLNEVRHKLRTEQYNDEKAPDIEPSVPAGYNTVEILKETGYSEEEIQILLSENCVKTN